MQNGDRQIGPALSCVAMEREPPMSACKICGYEFGGFPCSICTAYTRYAAPGMEGFDHLYNRMRSGRGARKSAFRHVYQGEYPGSDPVKLNYPDALVMTRLDGVYVHVR